LHAISRALKWADRRPSPMSLLLTLGLAVSIALLAYEIGVLFDRRH
jgi:hypothetical protein